MKTATNIQFGDSPRENAHLFFNFLKANGNILSIEDLQKIVPLSKPFLEEFSEIIKTEMSLTTDGYKETLATTYRVISKICDMSENDKFTEKQRDQLIGIIANLASSIERINNNYNAKMSKISWKYVVEGAGAVVLLAFLVNKSRKQDAKYNYPELGDFAPNGLRAINTSRRLRHCIGNW